MAKAFDAQFDASSYRPYVHVPATTSTSVDGRPSSTTSSPPRTYSRASPIRASPLQRGEACLNCRRRKMKCDAGKPSCAPCTRAGKASACEYEETRFLATIAALEEQVRQLRARIRQLEGESTDDAAGLPVPVPSSGFTAFLPTSSPTLSDDTLRLSPLSAHSHSPALGPVADSVTQRQQWSPYTPDELDFATDLQPNMVQHLISTFVPHAHEFGLPASSVPLLGRHSALTFAACAAASAPGDTEREFTLRADAALARPSIADVQASALLAQLAFARGPGREMEGQRYLGSAMRVARALGVDEETWGMVLRAERMGMAAVQVHIQPVVAEQTQTQTLLFDAEKQHQHQHQHQPTTWSQHAYGYDCDYDYDYGVQ